MDVIFKKRSCNEYDEELMYMTGEVLHKNVDITTLWNIRRLSIERRLSDDNRLETCKSLFDKEHQLTEACLKQNPKSYSVWAHRVWMLQVLACGYYRCDEDATKAPAATGSDPESCTSVDPVAGGDCPPPPPTPTNDSTVSIDEASEESTTSATPIDTTTPPASITPTTTTATPTSAAASLIPSGVIDFQFSCWRNELQLCNLFLEYDDRNFHCWDHRRFIVKNSPCRVTDEQEMKYSTKKINSNFSNFSSWHYRSSLFKRGNVEFDIKEEFSLVENAAFTDPDDQSIWFYHRWLISKASCEQNKPSLIEHEVTWCELLLDMEPDNKWIMISLIEMYRLLPLANNSQKLLGFLSTLKRIDFIRRNYYTHLEHKYRER